MPDLPADADFARLADAVDADLLEALPPLAKDPDVYGFALFVPGDAGAAGMMHAAGRESAVTAAPGTAVETDQRYSPVEWEPTPASMRAANDVLDELARRFEAACESLSEEDGAATHDRFIDRCAEAALTAMRRRKDAGSFGTIWYRVLTMSDDEHPVLKAAFEQLNEGRALEEARPLYDF